MRPASPDLVPAALFTALAFAAITAFTAPGCSGPQRNFGAGGETTTTTTTTTTSHHGTGGSGTTTTTGGQGGTATGGTGTGGTSTGGTGTGGTGTGGTGTGGTGTGGTGGNGSCNPFTSAECDIPAGWACDFNGAGFQCFGPPNTELLCQPCAGASPNFAYCQPGMTCHPQFQVCVAFCCIDNDCGTGGLCDFAPLGQTGVGVCVAGDLDGGPPSAPACNVPLVKPSGGACYMP